MSLASKHTIVPYMIFNNLCYLATLTLPLAWVLKRQKSLPLRPLLLCVILGVELIIVVIGAKDGAGTHHLLPAIFINAFLVDRFIRGAGEQRDDSGSSKAWYFMFIVGAVAVAFGLFKFNRTLASNWATAREATTELSAFAREFGALQMGVTDRSNYDPTSLRPILAQLGTQQIEFAAFMDTHYSGLSDAPLVEKMRNCSITHWVLPAKGEPFTLPNFYTRQALFSTELRSTFLDKYSKTREGKFFHVYKCRSNNGL